MPLSAHLLMTLPVIKDDLLSSHVMEGTTYALLQKNGVHSIIDRAQR